VTYSLKINDSTHFRQQYLPRKSYSDSSIIVNDKTGNHSSLWCKMVAVSLAFLY